MTPKWISELRSQVEDRFPEQWITLPVPTCNELINEIERLQALVEEAIPLISHADECTEVERDFNKCRDDEVAWLEQANREVKE